MSKNSKDSSRQSLSVKKMSKKAQALHNKILELSKTTKVKPKIVSNNDVYQFIDLE
tara:strand:- start:769 stop:936 length:168 start_codon:yes stop_codon:yes gene_type:complete